MMNGKSAEDRAAELVEDALLLAEQPGEESDQKARRDQHQHDRPGVVAELPQHPAGGGERERGVHRPALRFAVTALRIAVALCLAQLAAGERLLRFCTAGVRCIEGGWAVAVAGGRLVTLDEGEERGIRIVGSGVGEQAVGRRVGDDPAGPHEHESIAAERLVHDVARHDERRAARPRGRGTGSRARSAAPDRGRRSAHRARAARGVPSIATASETRVSSPPLSESMV